MATRSLATPSLRATRSLATPSPRATRRGGRCPMSYTSTFNFLKKFGALIIM